MMNRMEPARAAYIFEHTKQEKLRLDAALQLFWACESGQGQEQDDGRCREEWAAYIKKRIRPAVLTLTKQGEWDALALLAQKGMVPDRVWQEELYICAEKGDGFAWLKLLQIRGQEGQAAGVPETVERTEQEEAYGEKAQASFPDSQLAPSLQSICREVRGALYSLFPFLAGAMAALPWREAAVETMGTDGYALLCNSRWLADVYNGDEPRLLRLYLHTLLHCMLQHWEQAAAADEAGGWDKEALDAQVEALIEGECRRRPLCRERLGEALCSAEDTHGCWPRVRSRDSKENERLSQVREKWKMLGSFGVGTGEDSGKAGSGIGILRVWGRRRRGPCRQADGITELF